MTNAEFEKREKTLSRGDSITEEDEVFSANGEAHTVPEKAAAQKICLVLLLREGLGSLSRILKTFEVITYFTCVCDLLQRRYSGMKKDRIRGSIIYYKHSEFLLTGL